MTAATGMPASRPSLFEERSPVVIRAVELGMSLQKAATAAGVSDETLQNWRAKHPAFLLELQNARERGKLRLLAKIDAAGDDPTRWQANAWLLERTYPSEYALVNRVQLDARVVVENLRAIAGQLGIAIDAALEAEVLEEVRLIAAEDAANTRKR